MLKAPLDLAKARILVTNDDGIHAPGLKVLEQIARSLSDDVWVVAPESEQSGAAHSLTLRRPLQVRQLSARRFAVDGTPTDCVLLAVNHLIPAGGRTWCCRASIAAPIWARTSPIPAPSPRRWRRRCSAFRRSPSARLRDGQIRPLGDRRDSRAGGDPQAGLGRLADGVLMNVNFPDRAGRRR